MPDKKQLAGWVGGALLALGAHQAAALENISINGFLTAAGTIGDNDDNPYLHGLVRDDAAFDTRDSRLGLQISADVNPRMRLTAQLLARGGSDNWETEADWAFVGYRINDPLEVRAGKVKLSTFLVSDYIEVGYAYPWIRPPVEVYSLNPITTISGVDLLYRPQVGNWSFLVQPYVGTSNGSSVVSAPLSDATPPPPDVNHIPKGTQVDFEAKNMVGLNLSAGTDAFNFRLGYLTTDVASDFGGGFDGDKATFASAGFSMDWRNIVAYAEYAERDEDNMAETAFPDQKAWYTTLGYRIGKFMPHLTYAKLEEGKDASLLSLAQESITLGLRYELAPGAALKFEASQVEPETGNYGLFDAPPSSLNEKDYIFYGVAVDVIF